MSYLITQIFILLLIAGLLGLVLGWYLTRISAASSSASLMARLRSAETDARELRAELDAAVTARSNCDTERRLLADELSALRARQDAVPGIEDQGVALAGLQAELEECREALSAASPAPPVDRADDGVSTAPGTAALAAPPPEGEGPADDLQQIRGIGPKIAGILDELGIRRLDQIAAWTPENIEWVNGYLKFKGRVEREEWIAQARALLAARDDS